MKLFRFLAVTAFACVTAGLSAHESRAEQKLCINASTGASRVIDAETRCSKAETAVLIPGAVEGETIVPSSYVVPNSFLNYLSLTTADNGAQLAIRCSVNQVSWVAIDPTISARDVNIFNAVWGKPIEAVHNLKYNGGAIDVANITERPWTAVFTYKHKKAMSRFEVTFSEVNKRGDCLITLFSVGLGSASVVQPQPCGSRIAACVAAKGADKASASAP